MRVAAATLALWTGALWTGAAAGQGVEGFAVTYACAEGGALRAAYLNPADGPGLAVIDWDGALVPMRVAPSGSGAVYVDLDTERGLIWRTKGAAGTLSRRGPDGAEETLLRDCAAPQR